MIAIEEGRVAVLVEELDPEDVAPGSTLRPKTRYTDGDASVVLGRGEIFERAPLVWTLARWRFTAPRPARAVIEAAVADAPGPIYVAINSALTEDWAPRAELLAEAGFTLFAEKEGVLWTDDGRDIPVPPFAIADGTPDVLIPLIAEAQSRTRDRVDQRMYGDRPLTEYAAGLLSAYPGRWLVASDAAGPVGFAGLATRDGHPDTATLVLLGVRPERRGLGYGKRIVDAAYRAAREDGYRKVMSLIDVENAPSLRSVSRHGADPAADPWHRYVYAHGA